MTESSSSDTIRLCDEKFRGLETDDMAACRNSSWACALVDRRDFFLIHFFRPRMGRLILNAGFVR